MQKTISSCEAMQMSDQMCCTKCGLAWDMNDLAPPDCGKSTGIYRAASVMPGSRLINSDARTPVGYSVFVQYREHICVMIGWAFTNEQMLAIALQSLGYHGRVLAPVGMEFTLYREPRLDGMAIISRQRIAFTLPECNRAHQLLRDDPDPTTHWENVQLQSALQVRKLLGARA